MTPDDLAAVLKEIRGVEISKTDGGVYQHYRDEWPSANRAVKNSIGEFDHQRQTWSGIRGRLERLRDLNQGNTREASLLEDKLSDLSNLLDEYKGAVNKAERTNE
jgi:hypothetical protein